MDWREYIFSTQPQDVLNIVIIPMTHSITTYFLSYYIFPVAANSTFFHHHSETHRINILIPVRAKSFFFETNKKATTAQYYILIDLTEHLHLNSQLNIPAPFRST